MRMGQGVRTGLGHGGITCVLQTQFSSYLYYIQKLTPFLFLQYFLFISSPKMSWLARASQNWSVSASINQLFIHLQKTY